jgi:hypothetical protein
MQETRMEQAANVGLFLDLLFDYEDGCDNFLEKVCSLWIM